MSLLYFVCRKQEIRNDMLPAFETYSTIMPLLATILATGNWQLLLCGASFAPHHYYVASGDNNSNRQPCSIYILLMTGCRA